MVTCWVDLSSLILIYRNAITENSMCWPLAPPTYLFDIILQWFMEILQLYSQTLTPISSIFFHFLCSLIQHLNNSLVAFFTLQAAQQARTPWTSERYFVKTFCIDPSIYRGGSYCLWRPQLLHEVREAPLKSLQPSECSGTQMLINLPHQSAVPLHTAAHCVYCH